MNSSSNNGIMDQSERLQQQQKRRRNKSAWKRQRKAQREARVVQKSAGHVAKIVAELSEGRSFLNASTPNNNQPIAKFHRSEIVVGNMLGRGVFARVYNVQDFDLHNVEEEKELSEVAAELESEPQKLPPQDQIQLLQRIQEIEPVGERPLSGGRLGSISEDEDNDSDSSTSSSQESNHERIDATHTNSNNNNGSDSMSTAATSSTAPASAPPTPPLTPARDPAFSSKSQALNASVTIAPASEIGDARSTRSNLRSLRMKGSDVHDGMGGSMRYSQLLASRRVVEPHALRLQARDALREGHSHYALKHLTKTLLRNPKDFHLAAAALLLEAKYLSKLKHPNIVKVVGLAMAGGPPISGPTGNDNINNNMMADTTEDHSRRSNRCMSTRNGIGNKGDSKANAGDGEGQHHDSYFLITERLTDTLDRRIRQWKREQTAHKKLLDQSPTEKIQTWKHMMRKTSYALQVANALAYLHKRKLLYRDLKPQNIGFIGDNETIALINFGLCREVDAETGKAEEDEVTALFGAQSWKYTAVECFPKQAVQTTGEYLASSFLQQSSRSSLWESLSGSLHGSRHTRHTKMEPTELRELERELQVVQEQYQDEQELGHEHGSLRPVLQESSGSLTNGHEKSVRVVKPSYDVKVDVYAWAMVYYEMLTLNQPFSGMNRTEYLRKVAGPKGGQRPGVYQFDLTPSMISLLQRAWDQSPNKRPTVESIARNLQLILKELEELINNEHKAMLKAGVLQGSGADVAEDRAAKRAKRKEEIEKRKAERRKSKAEARKARSVIEKSKATLTGLFSKNQYRTSTVREAFASPSSVFGPLTEMTEAAVATVTGPASRISNADCTEVDLATLDYEEWSMGEGSESSSSTSSDSNDASFSASDNLADKEIIITPSTSAMKAGTDADESNELENDDTNDSDFVGDAISALNANKKRALPNQDRKMSNVSTHSGSSSGMRRRDKSKSMKSRSGSGHSLVRRGTNRMSRRTMRLSRASVWMMRRDLRILATVLSMMFSILLFASAFFWFRKRQSTWLGVDLRKLKKEHSEFESRAILHDAILEACGHEYPQEHNPNKPMIFQGGALSLVDLKCAEGLELKLDDKIAWVTGVPNKVEESQHVGFLNMHYFKKPPPQRKKNKYRRKKPWKFFREDEAEKTASYPSSITPSASLKYNSQGVHSPVPEGETPLAEESQPQESLPISEV